MAGQQDPLRLLRATLASKAPIYLLPSDSPSSTPVNTLSECTHLSFPSPTSTSTSTSANDSNERVVLPKTTPTRFKRTAQASAEQTWDLQSLLLCYMKKDASIAEYAQEAVKEGVELVGVMQRKIVADYLEGKDTAGAAAPYVVQDAPAGAVAQIGAQDSASGRDGAGADGQQVGAGNDVAGGDGRPAKKARYVVNKEDLEAYKKITTYWEAKQISDRTTVLHGSAKKANFSNVRDLVADRLKAGRDELRKGAHSSSGSHPGAGSQSQQVAQSHKRKRQANPIIIISPSSSALITMHNVKKFLEEAIYEPSDIARQAGGRVAEDVVQINHKRQIGLLAGETASGGPDHVNQMGGLAGQNRAERGAAGEKLVRYFVVDGVDALSKFGDDAWDRVVCVMTTGQEWQFRPYKWSEPKELFHHVRGIYPRFSNDPPNPKTVHWNVSQLKIDPSKRYLDKSVVSDFWRGLEGWTMQHKLGVVDF